jgi:outer membrane protein TolC
MRNRLWLGAALFALAAPAAAQRIAPLPKPPHSAPVLRTLTMNEVLASSRAHAPQVLEALAKLRAAEGKRLSIDGAFDAVFSADASVRPSGYYDGSIAVAKLVKPLETNGGSLFGSYRVSRGSFPIYEDESYTNRLGEVKAGAVFALLRDRLIDERRFGRVQADNDIDLADAERLMIAIGVQARAIEAYNAWVAAGQRLQVYRSLLELAGERQKGLERQVTAGFRPRIILTENEQNVLKRRTLVAQAEQALASAANTLSLYWRDAQGKPQTPSAAQLPASLPAPMPLPVDPRSGALARPDVRGIELRLNLAHQRLALDRNALLPRLDAAVEVSRDLGQIGLGGPSRGGTASKLGVSFKMPLQNRAAHGRIAQTQAEIEVFQRRRQALAEQVGMQVEGIAIAVRASRDLLGLATAERDRALEMAAAERRRFESGASDFFLVNVREEAAADADIRRLDAAYRQIVAHAELAAAAADLTTLGL